MVGQIDGDNYSNHAGDKDGQHKQDLIFDGYIGSSEPPMICPVSVPGSAISPSTDMVAIWGLKALRMAERIKGRMASLRLAPLAMQYLMQSYTLK